MMQTTCLESSAEAKNAWSCTFIPSMYLRGLPLRQEQGHPYAIYNHRFQVIEFGKSASRCEFLGFPNGFRLNSFWLSALYYSVTCSIISFGISFFYLHPLIQEHDQGVKQGLSVVGNKGRRS